MVYDLVVIGAGWSGFNAAVKAARMGRRVCLIEQAQIGGTCLNRGCIPTKVLYHQAKTAKPWTEIRSSMNAVVARLRDGMAFMIKQSKIDLLSGRAFIEASGQVRVADQVLQSEHVLIATGSVPRELPFLKFDGQKVISSDDLLALSSLPGRMLIVGAGAIGCEFASIFNRLGVKITLVEMAAQILPGFDGHVSRKLEQLMSKAGIRILTQTSADGLVLDDYDKVLVAVGRKSVSDGFWDDRLDLRSEQGSVASDKNLRTPVPRLFAAGDCIGGYMLAHVASYEGQLAVDNMFGESPNRRDYSVIPVSVFTYPEAASIGITEKEAATMGIDIVLKTVHFLSVGMAHVVGEPEGFLRVILEKSTGRILGVSLLGPQSTELVNFFSVLMKNGLGLEAIRKSIFAHPSLSEILSEVAA